MRVLLTKDELLALALTENKLLSLGKDLSDDFAFIGPDTLLPPGLTPEKCICIAGGVSEEAVIAQVVSSGFGHIVQPRSANGNELEEELRVAIRMLKNARAFFNAPLELILGEAGVGPTKLTFPFNFSHQKEDILLLVRQFLEEAGDAHFISDSVLRIADELFMNAFFNAPRDSKSHPRNQNLPRSTKINLSQRETATLLLGRVSDWLAVGCIDPFGSLIPSDLLAHLHQYYTAGTTIGIDDSSQGAGLGCHFMYAVSASFFISVEKGQRTAVFCKLPLGKSRKDSESVPKCLHIQYKEWDDMVSLKIDMQRPAGKTLFSFHGELNEDAVFPETGLEGCLDAMFDFNGLTALNSCGIREWIRWIKRMPPGARSVFVNCPKIVIDQINLVDGFLPPGGTVQSFHVPFFCEKCELEATALYQTDQILQGNKITLPTLECKQCHGSMQLDVIETKYFKFLKSTIQPTVKPTK